MSVARTACLDSLRSTMINIELILVTPANLDGFIVAGNPLHPAYKYLSLVHKADYLRAYFMHHHGGGYVDIKEINSDWLPAFEQLDENPTKWALGYGETSSQDVAQIGGRLGHDLKKYHRILLGNCAYIFRSNTPFTSEWLAEQERRLDNFLPHLLTNPGGVRNEVPNYPIAWTEILGDIFHPLCLKYSRRLIIDNRIKPNVKSHI